MRKLGISIYPEKTTEEKLVNYIDKAYSAGFSRIFSCLLSSAQNKGIEDKEIILKKFKKTSSKLLTLYNFSCIIDT